MKQILKRALCLIFMVVMSVSLLAGCSDSSSKTSSPPASESSPSAITANVGKDPNTDLLRSRLYPMSWLGSSNIPVAKAYDEMLSEFPNITITKMEANYDPTTQISLSTNALRRIMTVLSLKQQTPRLFLMLLRLQKRPAS